MSYEKFKLRTDYGWVGNFIQQYIGVKIVTATPGPNPKDGTMGYIVTYEHGYTSWSPTEVFDKAYLKIGYVKHLPQESQQLIGDKILNDDRLSKLKLFMLTPEFQDLPVDSQGKLSAQAELLQKLSDNMKALIELSV